VTLVSLSVRLQNLLGPVTRVEEKKSLEQLPVVVESGGDASYVVGGMVHTLHPT